MVTSLKTVPTTAQSLGAALGNLAGNEVAYQTNRGRLQNALQDVKGLANQPNANAFDVATALMSATAGIPGAEKYVGQLYPLLLQQIQRQSGARDFGPGAAMQQPGAQPQQGRAAGQPIQQGVPSEGQQVQNQIPSVTSIVPPAETPPTGNVADPNFGGPRQFVAPYSPQAIQQVRQKARELGYSPEMEERFVQDAVEMNNNARLMYQDQVASYNTAQQVRKDTLENQRQFTEYLEKEAKEFTDPDEKQLALQYSEQFQNEKSFAKRLAKVKEKMRPYQAAKKGLEQVLKRPLFGRTKDQIELAQRRAKLMVDLGQKDQLRMMIAAGGNGDIDEAILLNPLSQDAEKNLNKIPQFTDPFAKVTKIDPDSPEYTKQLQTGYQARLKQRDQTVDLLSNTIIPGNYNNPGTNLLLTRKHLMDHGASWDEAAQIIDQAILKGKIQLDPHQAIDYQKLGVPPLSGDDYLQNVLNYYLFYKE